ncbi:unnamed protein product [Calypogeia fissa]
MILVGGEPVATGNVDSEKETLLFKLLDHPLLVASANALRDMELQIIKPPQPSGNEDLRANADGVAGSECPSDPKYVYIFQKEFATVSPLFAELIGTDEITTCLGLAVRDPSSGLTSIGHFDTADSVLNGVNELVNSVVSLSSSTFQVHLVGAFDDSSEYSDQAGAVRPVLNSAGREELQWDNTRRKAGWSWPLAMRMIEILQNSVHNFELETFFVLKHNTTFGPSGHACPIFRGLVVETSSGRLLPAVFEPEARCPDGTVRGVCTTTVSADPRWVATLLSPYDTLSDTFKIYPFKWGGEIERYSLYMLTLEDAPFLDTFSTSPYAEGPDFLPTSRRIFNYIKNFPQWQKTFPNHEPRVFTRTSTGGWVRKNP